jgi:hypothetical protein
MFKKKLQNLQLGQLTAIFLASMLGSLLLTVMLRSTVEPGVPVALPVRILVTVTAIVVYASIVWTTFFFLLPRYRPALLRIVQIKSH